MDFGGTPRAGAVLDRVSAPRADESETGRWFEGIRDRLQQSDAAVGAVITPTRKSTFFTPLAAYQPVVKVPRSGDRHDPGTPCPTLSGMPGDGCSQKGEAR